jgi:flagellar biogenesis protein FliO
VAVLLTLTCIGALGAGPAPAPASSTAPAPATAPTVKESALEREPIRRGADVQHAPSTMPTTGESRNRATNSNGSGTAGGAGGSSAVDLRRVGLSLAIVLGLIFVARVAMKRLFPAVSVGRNSQVIRVVSRSVVGPKQQFLLVKLGNRLVLVGDSGSSMNPLAEVTDPNEVAELIGQLQSESPHSSASAFASIFRKAETQFEPEDEPVAPPTSGQLARRELLDEGSSDRAEEPAMPDRKLVAVASEINGLMDRVRLLSNRVRRS